MNGGLIPSRVSGNTPATSHPSEMERQIMALGDLSMPELRKHWARVFNVPTPRGMSRDLLSRGISYKLQEQALGGLSQSTKRRLKTMAGYLNEGKRGAFVTGPTLKPGAKVVREWRAKAYTVTVLEEGFEYNGKRYQSLSAIAREITGVRWSGPRFFGLAGRRREQIHAT